MAKKLRDLCQPIDVPLLDATVAAFYETGSKEEEESKLRFKAAKSILCRSPPVVSTSPATLLEEIGKEKCRTDSRRRGQIEADPELDEFMES